MKIKILAATIGAAMAIAFSTIGASANGFPNSHHNNQILIGCFVVKIHGRTSHVVRWIPGMHLKRNQHVICF